MSESPLFTTSAFPSVSTSVDKRQGGQPFPLHTWWSRSTGKQGQLDDRRGETRSLVSMAAYTAVGSLAIVTITGLFCFFFLVSLFDDFVRIALPNKLWQHAKERGQLLIDWPELVNKLSLQLTQFAQWERSKRASWSQRENNDDGFHDLVVAVTTYLDRYVQSKRQQQEAANP
ncbi:hypothetical protein BCR43DRAFT_482981 [Syncephalastrum racemosum]|uniref:Uncharacterized protein n=1 Tax=Syncephalastrum racemosum TaxID=13706 RepID=A0A1X2HUG1_SYNRA|nr:hypothetical protein BCR43DRAFT_482981 [Syncephalastrum racemosum]